MTGTIKYTPISVKYKPASVYQYMYVIHVTWVSQNIGMYKTYVVTLVDEDSRRPEKAAVVEINI